MMKNLHFHQKVSAQTGFAVFPENPHQQWRSGSRRVVVGAPAQPRKARGLTRLPPQSRFPDAVSCNFHVSEAHSVQPFKTKNHSWLVGFFCYVFFKKNIFY